jgi:hypothetical protein
MICELISFSAAELNTGIDVIKDIEFISIVKNDAEALPKVYRPIEIRFSNVSGIAANIDIFSDIEHAAYLTTPTLSDKITIANGGTLTLTPTKDAITKIVAKGTAGHSGNLNITIIKE